MNTRQTWPVQLMWLYTSRDHKVRDEGFVSLFIVQKYDMNTCFGLNGQILKNTINALVIYTVD